MSDHQPSASHEVIARKYRPDSFAGLVGQKQIAAGLSRAIEQNRIGQAYLFTGARGVGKTSTARIFAKCLNCLQGPSPQACGECEICQAITAGDDIDVLEIDGASNRGIDEIRQLRSNVGIRPSRSRYKIYIIDEVHMLTKEAFNALLKTLEEPPEHVKFIFCTTEPHKIPITVLSRCQRFDFSPITVAEIKARLMEIADREGYEIAPDAAELVARRAGGSMRDSQTLLEQLFSFCEGTISAEEVHQFLGTSDVAQLARIAEAIAAHDSPTTLGLLDQSIAEGVDPARLLLQLVEYFRDAMAVCVKASPDTLLLVGESELADLQTLADGLGLETVLNILQVLDGAAARMKESPHARTILEVAVVRSANLHHLDSLADLVAELGGRGTSLPESQAVAAGAKSDGKKNARLTPEGATKAEVPADPPASATFREIPVESTEELPDTGKGIPETVRPAPVAQSSEASATREPRHASAAGAEGGSAVAVAVVASLTAENLESLWAEAVREIGDLTADIISQYRQLELTGPAAVRVTLPDIHNRDWCNRSDRRQKIESVFEQVSGVPVRIEFTAAESAGQVARESGPRLTRRQQILQLRDVPLVRKTLEIFDADIVDYQEPPDAG